MINRKIYFQEIIKSIRRSPVTALLGPRQVGKTTLARAVAQDKTIIGKEGVNFFDLESQPDLQRLQNPELALSGLNGLIIIDEIQLKPELFAVLRVLVDKPENQSRFLILGSASPDIVKNVSETLAGRVNFIELNTFNLTEIHTDNWEKLWIRGGFPRAFLADSDDDSVVWREGFIRTFLERDLPQLGISISAPAMRRFWTMLAHYHGQTWNASDMARSMGLSDKTVRSYLDILTGAFMLRQLQPWYANIKKRQVKSPKIYLRDSGLLHNLLILPDKQSLLAHPQVGASWEGFVLEQALQILKPEQAYFWATHSGAELDIFFIHRGKNYGIEIKFNEAPKATRSMRIAIELLNLQHLWVIYPGQHIYPIDKKLSMYPFLKLPELPLQLKD